MTRQELIQELELTERDEWAFCRGWDECQSRMKKAFDESKRQDLRLLLEKIGKPIKDAYEEQERKMC